MACISPFELKNINYNPDIKLDYFQKKMFQVPCGKCLCCIASKKTELKHRAIYEAKKYGADNCCFVTLTYTQDAEITLGCYVTDDLGRLKYKDGSPILSCRYKHFQDYLKRLRINLQRSNQGIKVPFSFLVCQEYGDKGERNHFHVIFFGLNVAHEQYIKDAWRFPCSHPETKFDDFKQPFLGGKPQMIGRVQVEAPNDLSKSIGYITKYMSKSVSTPDTMKTYDAYGMERPLVKHSNNFGSNLFESQIDYIKSHNYCYRFDGQDFPVPLTIKNKLLGYRKPDYSKVIEEMKERGIKECDITEQRIYNFKRGKAIIQHEKLLKKDRLSGTPHDNPDYMSKISYLDDTAYIERVEKSRNSHNLHDILYYTFKN